MKIFGIQSAAGYSSEKSEKQSRVEASKSDSGALFFETGDDLALTGKKAAVLNLVHETNIEAAHSAPNAGDLSLIRQKLTLANNRILSNPIEALSAQANLTSETVADLIG